MLKTRAGDTIGAHVPDIRKSEPTAKAVKRRPPPPTLTEPLDDRDILFTRAEAAQYLRKSEPTLERWARQGIGPQPIKIGPRDVRYTLRSLRTTAGTEAA